MVALGVLEGVIVDSGDVPRHYVQHIHLCPLPRRFDGKKGTEVQGRGCGRRVRRTSFIIPRVMSATAPIAPTTSHTRRRCQQL